jgi:sugar porter (SP) family MFS transporter
MATDAAQTDTGTTPSGDGPDEAVDDRTMIFGRWGLWLTMVGVVTMLAGLLFGYDQGVISGALPLITKDFGLTSFVSEIVTSWVTVGALFGALAAGLLADKAGRKKTGMIAGALFMSGAAIEAFAPGTAVLVVGRFVIGFGVGIASVAAPLYAAELAPRKTRGRFVSTYQLAITMGIFVADLVDDVLTESGNWRLMLGGAAIPGLLLLLCMAIMPESPRWLMKMLRRPEATASLAKVRGSAGVEAALDEVQADLDENKEQATWGEVFGRSMRKPLMVGVGLAVFQQITGINAVIYYSNEIFQKAGFVTPQDQAQATLYAVGAVNVLATFIAVAYVDRFGRRPLLLAGLVGMTVSLTTVGFAFLAFDESATNGGTTPSVVGIITLISLVVFIASFAFSLGPVVWTVISEIYPNRVRGRAIAVTTAVNWAAAGLVSLFFLSLLNAIGSSATFWLFAFFGVVAYVWIWKKVPETKGRSLEEIQEIWTHDDVVAHTTDA